MLGFELAKAEVAVMLVVVVLKSVEEGGSRCWCCCWCWCCCLLEFESPGAPPVPVLKRSHIVALRPDRRTRSD